MTRKQPSLAVKLPFGGRTWIFDAGEGSMHGNFGHIVDVRRIFITHMHGDHVNGLPGLLCRLGAIRRNAVMSSGGIQRLKQFDEPLEVYGPAGLGEYLYHTLSITKSRPALRYRVHEFRPQPPKSEDIARRLHAAEVRPVFHVADESALQKDGKTIYRVDGKSLDPDDPLSVARDFDVVACEIRHKADVQTLGFVLQEPDLPRKILAENVKARLDGHAKWLRDVHNMTIGQAMEHLKREQTLPLSDGTFLDPTDPSEQILGPKRPGRKLCILGDTYDPRSIQDLARNSDLLVHEASFFGRKRAPRHAGHSTAAMAGAFAKSIGAKALAMNHLSPECCTRRAEEQVRKEAKIAACDGVSNVYVARDGLTVNVDPPE